jgi:hypothetical protein
VPEYRHTIFLICVVSTACFGSILLEKRLELKSLKGQTKAEELEARCPELLSLRVPIKAL